MRNIIETATAVMVKTPLKGPRTTGTSARTCRRIRSRSKSSTVLEPNQPSSGDNSGNTECSVGSKADRATVKAMLRPHIVPRVVDDMVLVCGGEGFFGRICLTKFFPKTGKDFFYFRPRKILPRSVPVRLRLLPAGEGFLEKIFPPIKSRLMKCRAPGRGGGGRCAVPSRAPRMAQLRQVLHNAATCRPATAALPPSAQNMARPRLLHRQQFRPLLPAAATLTLSPPAPHRRHRTSRSTSRRTRPPPRSSSGFSARRAPSACVVSSLARARSAAVRSPRAASRPATR